MISPGTDDELHQRRDQCGGSCWGITRKHFFSQLHDFIIIIQLHIEEKIRDQ